MGHERIVAVLLAMPGIDVNCTDQDGTTPLEIARDTNHENGNRIAALLRSADIARTNACATLEAALGAAVVGLTIVAIKARASVDSVSRESTDASVIVCH